MKRKAEFRLRHLFYLMLILSFVMMMASLFITDMSQSYDNEDMEDEWRSSTLNSSSFSIYNTLESNITGFQNDTQSGVIDDVLNSLGGVGTALKVTGSILVGILAFPNYMGELISNVLLSLEVPSSISNFIGGIIILMIWVVIIFGLISLAGKGSKV